MKKRKYIVGLLLLLGLLSCTSYQKLKPSFFKDLELGRTVVVSELPTADFDIYVFNICEYYYKGIDGTERFVACPENFFEVSEKENLKKVEELYLLKHKTSDLVLYMTTFSHKYVAPQKGFLNDRLIYKDKFYLRNTEFIYLGKYNKTNFTISFKKQGSDERMIWYFSEALLPTKINTVLSMDVETVENSNKKDKNVVLQKVFSIPYSFIPSKYALLGRTSLQDSIGKIYLLKNKAHKMQLIFEVNDSLGGYRFPARKVLYYTE